MARLEFSRFLDAALRTLAAELPAAYVRMAEVLGEQPLGLEVDGERMQLCFAGGRHRVESEGGASALLRTSYGAILALIDGRTTLLRALHDESLWLQGPPARVIAFDAALRAFVAGAVRAPGFGPLLADYRLRGAERDETKEEI